MQISIHNLRKEKPIRVNDVKVDRSSVLGNPFLLSSELQRDQVCDKYANWLSEQVKNKTNAYYELVRLKAMLQVHGELRLFCWCVPKRCHAETIREALLSGTF